LGFRDLFTKSSRGTDVHGTRVLVCGLDRKFEELIGTDAKVYSQFYPSTTVTPCMTIHELLRTIRGYDIVHLFVDVSPIGLMADASANELGGTDLIEKCGDSGVKLLWLASDNKPEGYIKGFKPLKPLNLVITIRRNGAGFADFLAQLLSRMSGGEAMPNAWAALAPQAAGDPHHDRLPATIFSAGLGGARFQ